MKNVVLFLSFYILTSHILLAQNNLKTQSIQTLDSIAKVFYAAGDVENAMTYWEAAVEKAKAVALDSTYASMINNLGITYEEMGDMDYAESLYQEARELTNRLYQKNHLSYLESISNLAYLYRYKKQYPKVIPLQEEAVQVARKLFGNQHAKYAETLNNLATSYSELNQFDKAESLFLEVLKIEKKVLGTNHPDYAASINNFAGLYHSIGNIDQAEALFIEALQIRKKTLGTKHPLYALNLYNLGHLYYKTNRLDEAEPLFVESINIEKSRPHEANLSLATSMTALALLYADKKKYAEAEALYLSALEKIKSTVGTSHANYAATLSNLSVMYYKMGQLDKVEPMALEVLKIYEKTYTQKNTFHGSALHNAAVLYKSMGKIELAEKFSWKAYLIYQELLGNEHPSTLNELTFSLEVAAVQSKKEQVTQYANWLIYHNCKKKEMDFAQIEKLDTIAVHLLKNANLEFNSNQSAIRMLARISVILFDYYKKEKNVTFLKKAYNCYQIAIQVSEKVRNEFSNEASKLRALSEMPILMSNAILNAEQLIVETKDNSYIENILYFIEQNKSIFLLDALKGTKAKSLGVLPDSLAQQEATLQKEQDELQKKLDLVRDEAQKAILVSKKNELSLKTDLFLSSLKEKHPHYHALKYKNITANLADIQKLLDKETALLEYFVTPSGKVYLLEITSKNAKIHLLSVDSLNQHITLLRTALSNYSFIAKQQEKAYKAYTNTAYWFYENLLKVALDNKSIKNLIIIADGNLGHLPFESFLTKPASQSGQSYNSLPYLVNKYNISYNYSATLWKENLLGEKKNNNSQLLAFGADYTPIKDSSFYDLRDIYTSKLRTSLNPLSAVTGEINTLSEQFQGSFLQKEVANEAYFKENAKDYAVIHLAMHGVLNTSSPMLSSLAFTEDLDSLEDNFLQAYEISKLNLNADLVVLSACETGYGKFQQGEGVLSLARSFMYAGVPSLVVSLWQVNDGSTAILMKEFYTNLAKGMTKDAALREAKLYYIKNAEGILAHPAFWSPFIQLGDNRAIALQTKGGYLIWGIGAGLLALVGVGLFAMRRRNA